MSFRASTTQPFEGLLPAVAATDNSAWCFVPVGTDRIAAWSAGAAKQIPWLRRFFTADSNAGIRPLPDEETQSDIRQWKSILAQSYSAAAFDVGDQQWEVHSSVVLDHDGRPCGQLLRFTACGESVSVNELRSRSVRAQERLRTLSPRETEIVNLVSKGLTNRTIATLSQISHKTVEKHRDRINRKLGTRNVVEVVRIVADAQLFDQPEGT